MTDATSQHARHPHLPWPMLLMIGGVVAYALAVYWSSLHPSAFTLLLASLPFAWVSVSIGAQGSRSDRPAWQRVASWLPTVLLLAVLVLAWDQLLRNFRLMYLTEHVAIHVGLCGVFARSLLPGRTPLCTEMASWVHEDMESPRLRWYTRQVTKAWALFFAAMAFCSIMVYLTFAPSTWTTFSAVVGPVLTGAMFVAENAARNFFLPPRDRVGLAGTWRAVRARLDAQARASGRTR